jgi:hypothetical protein
MRQTPHSIIDCAQKEVLVEIKTSLEFIKDNSAIKELIEAKLTGIHAEIMANHEIEESLLREVMKRQDKTNGTIIRHEELLLTLDILTKDIIRDYSIIRYMKNNPIKSVLIAFAFVVIGAYIADKIDIRTLIDLLK